VVYRVIEQIVKFVGILPVGNTIVEEAVPDKYAIDAAAPFPEAVPLVTPDIVALRPLPVKSVSVVPLKDAALYFAHGGFNARRAV
jgi:hypothetical protein